MQIAKKSKRVIYSPAKFNIFSKNFQQLCPVVVTCILVGDNLLGLLIEYMDLAQV